MAERAVLQMDDAEPAGQDLAWVKRKRSDDTEPGRSRTFFAMFHLERWNQTNLDNFGQIMTNT